MLNLNMLNLNRFVFSAVALLVAVLAVGLASEEAQYANGDRPAFFAKLKQAEAEGRARLAQAGYTPVPFTAKYKSYNYNYFDSKGERMKEIVRTPVSERVIAMNGNLDRLFMENRIGGEHPPARSLLKDGWKADIGAGPDLKPIGLAFRSESLMRSKLAMPGPNLDCLHPAGYEPPPNSLKPPLPRQVMRGYQTVLHFQGPTSAPPINRDGPGRPHPRGSELKVYRGTEIGCAPVLERLRVFTVLPVGKGFKEVYMDVQVELESLEFGEPAPSLFDLPDDVEWLSFLDYKIKSTGGNEQVQEVLRKEMQDAWAKIHPDDKLQGRGKKLKK